MSNRGDLLRVRAQFERTQAKQEPRLNRFLALMGDGEGNLAVPGMPLFVYVRVLGRGVVECLNQVAPLRNDLPIIVGYDFKKPDTLQVLSIYEGGMASFGPYAYLPPHHQAHEFRNANGGDDVVWIQKQQVLPLLAHPTSPTSMTVVILDDWYPWDTGWHYFEETVSADLTAHIPALAAQARYVLISVDGATEALQYTIGGLFPVLLPPPDAENMIPTPPSGSIPIVGVYLTGTTTAIDWENLYDLRLFNQPVGGSVSPGPHSLLDSTVHDDTVTNAPTRGSLVVGDATPEWNELIHPLAAGYALTTDANDVIWNQTPAWTGQHSFGAGIAFTGATGVNSITIPDNLANALHIIDAGDADVYLQIVTTTGSEEVIFNAGGDDVDFTAQAVGVADALQVQGSDGQITLGVLTAGFVKSSAGGVLSVALEVALAELAGYVRGSIIRGGAADWEAHDAKTNHFILVGDGVDITSKAFDWDDMAAGAGADMVHDHTGPAEGGLIILGFPAVAGAGYVIVSDGVNSWIVDQTPLWTGEHSFEAGVAFVGASGVNEITVPDNTAIALEILDAGGLEYLRIVSTDVNPYFLLDPAGVGINVGIGTAAPAAALEIQDGDFYLSDSDVAHGMTNVVPTDVYGRLTPVDATKGGLGLYGMSDDADIGGIQIIGIIGVADPTDTTSAVRFIGGKKNGITWQALGALETVFSIANYGTTLLTALGSGNIGLGTPTPAHSFDVLDDVAGDFIANFFNDGDNVNRYGIQIRGGGEGVDVGITYFIYVEDHAAAATGWIGTIDGVFALHDVSDEGRKANIRDTKAIGLDVINGLRVRDFNWKANPGGPVMISFIAQEAREVYPAMVGEALDGTLTTSRATLIPILTKAVQELDARLTQVEMY